MKLLIMVCALMISTISAYAQIDQFERSQLNTAAFYNYSSSGDVTITMHVWGTVRFPGLYEIPRGTRLSEVISLAGGPQFPERNRRSNRTVKLQLHRNTGTNLEVKYEAEMANEIVFLETDPIVEQGDFLSFEAVVRRGISWRDIFPIVSMVGTLTIMVDRLAE